jgi:hypothetical protein
MSMKLGIAGRAAGWMMLVVAGSACAPARSEVPDRQQPRRTTVTIDDDRFLINGRPTY